MKIYICNAFSLSMLDREAQRRGPRRFPEPVDHPAVLLQADYKDAEIISAVGHADTAAIFTHILGRGVPVSRISVRLVGDDRALIGQYIGPRLPEGATMLPEGARIEWWIV
jgi:Domain of unknown function (DUF1874)